MEHGVHSFEGQREHHHGLAHARCAMPELEDRSYWLKVAAARIALTPEPA